MVILMSINVYGPVRFTTLRHEQVSPAGYESLLHDLPVMDHS